MLRPEEEAKLDSLSRLFRAAFQRRFAHVPHREEMVDCLVVTLPAPTQETGDITVWLEGDEVTVAIGKHYHRHFETYLRDEPVEIQERDAVESALDFIEEFITEKLFLRVSRKGERIVSAALLSVDSPDGAQSWLIVPGGDAGPDDDDWHEADYVWSGPRNPRH
jgi:hypothetical protein